jgi:hypothetical protein
LVSNRRLPVGRLDRKSARSFRKQFIDAGAAGVPAVCTAIIVRGWYCGGDDQSHFGARLELPTQ